VAVDVPVSFSTCNVQRSWLKNNLGWLDVDAMMFPAMTIEAWNILLSAVILVLMTGGGLWLKYVVEQQLKTKDTTIEALKGVVELKNAHIASLEGNTAPAIVKAYADMREHADQIDLTDLLYQVDC
jgi:hypothetical protein